MYLIASKASKFLGKMKRPGRSTLLYMKLSLRIRTYVEACIWVELEVWLERGPLGCVSGCAKASSCKKLRGLHVLWGAQGKQRVDSTSNVRCCWFGDVGYNNKNLKLLSEMSSDTLNSSCFRQLMQIGPFVFWGKSFVIGKRKWE